MERALLEGYLNEGLSLTEIGALVGKDATTVGYWLKKHGLKATGHDRYAPRGGIERDRLKALVEAGLTLEMIAAELERSVSTVRHWLRRHDLETLRAERRRARRSVALRGETRVEMVCPSHGLSEFVLERRGSYRCTRCRSEAVSARRRRVKGILVEEAGGCCQLCGYSRYVGALHFHHLDPETKSFSLGYAGVTRSLDKAREEARKCVLLCSNCHAEVEGGLVSLPPPEAKLSDVAQAA